MSEKGKRKFWPPAWWRQQKRKRTLKAEVRARDGDRCWRCNHPMRFDGLPNRGKAATIEHVLPLSKGGGWALENLRLCHVGCNRHLKDHAPERKERMRINVAMRP